MGLSELCDFIEARWARPASLLAGLIALSGAVSPCLVLAGKSLGTIAVVVGGMDAIAAIIWALFRRTPRTPRDRLGFIISLSCPDDQQSRRLREDFVEPLRRLVRSGRAGRTVFFIDMPQHIAQQVRDVEDAQILRTRARAHFIVFGTVRLRTLSGQEHHVVELEGIVAHRPLPKATSGILSAEFSALFPHKLAIPTDNDMFTFQFTSEWTDIVARYIIGFAAALSGDLDYAENLYRDALDRLLPKGRRFPVYAKLAQVLPIRLSELYEVRARVDHLCWVEDHAPSHIENLGRHLLQVHESRLTTPGIVNLRAIYAFLSSRDTAKAITILRSIPEKGNATWHTNIAFLEGYCGDLRGAMRAYVRAARCPADPEMLTQAEDFMCWVTSQEPELCQVHFCLGMFNRYLKGDEASANTDFTRFIDCASKRGKFHREVALAKSLIATSTTTPSARDKDTD